MTEKLYPWQVHGKIGSSGIDGYCPIIGFVWIDSATDRAKAIDLARLYYGTDKVEMVYESEFGDATPPTGFVPK